MMTLPFLSAGEPLWILVAGLMGSGGSSRASCHVDYSKGAANGPARPSSWPGTPAVRGWRIHRRSSTPSTGSARALSGLAEEQRGATVRLTPREGELLSLLSGGYRNKELASMLGIKEQTVKMHLYRLFQKLQVKSRMAAVLAASARDEPLGKAGEGR